MAPRISRLLGYGVATFLLMVSIALIWQQISPRKALVIVEPRKHKNLKYVIENFDERMDSSWDLYVFHGQSAATFAKEASRSVKKRNVYLLPLDTDNLTADEYNALFKNPAFWNRVHAETILVFQTDVVLCKNSLQHINNFTKYDYIGCSIDDKTIGFGGWRWSSSHVDDSFYGVGGMSLRKKSFMLKCIMENPTIDSAYPEDVFYSNCVAKSSKKPESAVVINNFCTQNTYNNNSLGAHRISMLTPADKERFLQYCPEAHAIK